ncbi:MAG TPA: tetratricopeptide repeat protein [Bryobacteraceae bacterium]|nr:tetratricopeptide repeat protein [Bryobacteraceae bacterium]
MIRKIVATGICLVALGAVALAWRMQQNRQANERDARSILPRAEAGDPEAQYHLARLYYYGQGVRQDYSEAFRWSRKAADQGNVKALYTNGIFYDQGKGVAQDEVEAIRWYRQAADRGYPLAEQAMGYVYFTGRGVALDYSEAARWYRLAADQGDRRSQSALAYLYHTGQGVPRNETEAQTWYRKSAESDPAAGSVLRFLNREPRAQASVVWQIVGVTLVAMLLAVAGKSRRRAAE